MFTKLILWLYALLTVQGFEMNMTQYYKMPSLYDLDDYDRCLHEFQHLSMYCFVRADVSARPDAEAWQIIQDVSQYYKHHFDHGHLYFGICVEWCQSQIDDLAKNEADALFTGILKNNTKVNTYLNLFKSEAANRLLLNPLMNQCVNLRLKKYGLSAESVIEYCDKSNKVLEHDAWNFTLYGVLCVLTLLVVASSLFDLYLKHKNNDKLLTDRDHYKAAPDHIGSKMCVSFSIARNWYRLDQEPSDRTARELRFLDCFKFFSMFLVIFAHSNWALYEGAITNPQDPERMLHSNVGTLLVSGALITVTFFVISGFLMTLSWLVIAKKNKEMSAVAYLANFLKFSIFRYLRLTIPYGFVILWSGSYFDSAGGPMFRHIFEREQLTCRKNWWINLLYLNNYINTNERCMLQAWYLASDMQSFVLSLIILMLAHKFSKRQNWIFGVTVALSVVIPGVATYLNGLNGLFIPAPQVQRDSFIESRQFNELYVPFHMNFGSFFLGVLAALTYVHISSNQVNIRQSRLFQIVFCAIPPLAILWLFSGYALLQNYNDKDMLLWSSVFASIQRIIWSLGLCVIIVGMSAKRGWVFRRFCSLPIFRLLGRLTYGTFMVHLIICRVVIATQREPIYFGTGMMFAFIVFTMCASYVVSFVLSIVIELPVSSLLKLIR